ncbi:hypothetical protein NQ317_006819 [Molorchus minor]|uniref:Uncharacterized protein n=1 Tax=Molorchus minor TaxID=1323400 RepID=A0ABQ9J3Y1_9CUCU|nr:hypothetical protein NQ317_006819 [Molorchus minor]
MKKKYRKHSDGLRKKRQIRTLETKKQPTRNYNVHDDLGPFIVYIESTDKTGNNIDEDAYRLLLIVLSQQSS